MYEEVDFVEEHWAAFTSMIDQRSELQSITLTGIKVMIRLADGLRASKKICSPSFPNSNLEEVIVKSPIRPPEIFRPTTFWSLFDLLRTRRIEDGFKILMRRGLSVDSKIIAVFSDLSLLSASIEEWSRGTLRHPYMIDFANIRLNIQHRLLSPPSAGEFQEPCTDRFSYEACRLRAILYPASVTFPIPPYPGPQGELVRRIWNALSQQGEYSTGAAPMVPYDRWDSGGTTRRTSRVHKSNRRDLPRTAHLPVAGGESRLEEICLAR